MIQVGAATRIDDSRSVVLEDRLIGFNGNKDRAHLQSGHQRLLTVGFHLFVASYTTLGDGHLTALVLALAIIRLVRVALLGAG